MSQSPDPNPSLLSRWLEVLRRPSTLIATGSVIVVGTVVYTGGRIWLQRNLPSWIATQLSQRINRPVEIGGVNNLSLNRITIKDVNIPPTQTDPDNLTLETVDVRFNILPLLIGRPLVARAKVADLDVYIAEEAPGQWVELELPEATEPSEPPIKLDVTLQIENAGIELQPQATEQPVAIAIEGQARYTKQAQQEIEFDIESTIASSAVNIQGNSILDTGKTQIQIQTDPLNLVPIFGLIPNNPITLDTGTLEADVEGTIAPGEIKEATRGQGRISVDNLRGTLNTNQERITADAELIWAEQTIQIKQALVSLGELTGEMTGKVDWQQGYQLQLNLETIDIPKLTEGLGIELPVPIAGQLDGQIEVNGPLDAPQVRGNIYNTTAIDVDRIDLNRVETNFEADLNQIKINNLIIEPTVGGEINITGAMETSLGETIAARETPDWSKMPLIVTLRSQLPLNELIASYYQLPPNLALDQLRSLGIIQGTLANPAGKIEWQLTKGNSNIQGQGKILLQNQVINVYNTSIQSLQGNININAIGDLEKQIWSAQINGQNLYLRELLPPEINTNQINLNRIKAEVQGNFDLEAIEDWSGQAQLDLTVDQGSVSLDSNLAQGTLDSQLAARSVTITPEINLNQAQANLSIPLEPLLEITRSQTPNLDQLQGQIQANLNINNQGQLNTTTLINEGQWNSEITANQIQLSALTEFVPSPLNAQIQLQGELAPLLQPNPTLPVAVNQADLTLGENRINSQGQIQLSLQDSQPEIDLVDLDVAALVNLAELPLNTIIEQLEIPVALKPTSIDVSGLANFTGNLRGEQLLSEPLAPGNLYLAGQLELENLNFNQRQFDPLLAGPVLIAPGEVLSIDLRGSQDVIAANLEACDTPECKLPYLPTSYAFRQGEAPDAIVVSGIRQEQKLVSRVSNFPLNIFNLAPAESFGIPGVINGIVTADLVVDLENFATTGELMVSKPSLGYIELDVIETEFAFDPQDAEAQLVSSALKFKDTEYNLVAGIDLDTGALTGKLDLNQNDINDILQTLQWSNLDDVLRLLSPPDYASAQQIQDQSLGKDPETLAEKVNLLWLIERRIQQTSQQIRSGNSTLELDIRGEYGGEVLLAGTIFDPQVEFNLEGNNWQWLTRPPVLNIVEPLGVVWETEEVVPIRTLQLTGNFSDGVVAIEPLLLEIGNAVISLKGNLALEGDAGAADFKVENLSTDLIDKFVDIPLDVIAFIDINGSITGGLDAPTVDGELEVSQIALSGKPLLSALRGEFNYDPTNTASFRTTFPEQLQLAVSVPSPSIEGGQGVASLDLSLSSDVFERLGIITQGQLSWQQGDGNVLLSARLPLDWSEPLDVNELIQALQLNGEINFVDAVIDNTIVSSELILDGQVRLDGQLLKIDNLSGNVGETQFSVAGVFPLVQPPGAQAPDVGNPLTVNIQEGEIELEGLYKGGIEGLVVLQGTALKPLIGGEVMLSQGQVFVPEGEENPQNGDLQVDLLENKEVEPPIPIVLRDFQLKTQNLRISQFSLYQFNFGGDLTLNGELTQLENIDAVGDITLTRGEIVFLDTQFFLAPRYTSQIKFRPDQGLFNPDLDIKMETAISEAPDQNRLSTASNEVRDDLFSTRSGVIRVTVSVEARANQIIPQLGRDPSTACEFHSDTKPPIVKDLNTEKKLEQLETCIFLSVLAENEQANGDILTSPAVDLSSSPSRPKSEILELLAGQLLGLAENLENQTGLELLQLGADQFLVGPLLRDVLFGAEQFVRRGGERVGLDDFRVYPVVESVYNLNNDSSIRVTYDYFFNEGQVRYELGF